MEEIAGEVSITLDGTWMCHKRCSYSLGHNTGLD